MALPLPLPSVLPQFGLDPAGAEAWRPPSGLIQTTYIVRLASGRRVVVQRLHPVFGDSVMQDIDAVTAELERLGITTQRPLRTHDGRYLVPDEEGGRWRVMTFVDGVTFDRADSLEVIAEAARMVARFHRALATSTHEFVHVRANVHDTAAHLARLREVSAATPDPQLAPLAAAILVAADALPRWSPSVPRRITHGDLKLSNVLFSEGTPQAVALIDLDTLGRQVLAYEIGDALRSWCNRGGEDLTQATLEVDVFRTAVTHYLASAGDIITVEERRSLVPGFQTVATELAARFCVDAYEDRYFGWNPARFPSRREHNRVRALGQLDLARQVGERADELQGFIE